MSRPLPTTKGSAKSDVSRRPPPSPGGRRGAAQASSVAHPHHDASVERGKVCSLERGAESYGVLAAPARSLSGPPAPGCGVARRRGRLTACSPTPNLPTLRSPLSQCTGPHHSPISARSHAQARTFLWHPRLPVAISTRDPQPPAPASSLAYPAWQHSAKLLSSRLVGG